MLSVADCNGFPQHLNLLDQDSHFHLYFFREMIPHFFLDYLGYCVHLIIFCEERCSFVCPSDMHQILSAKLIVLYLRLEEVFEIIHYTYTSLFRKLEDMKLNLSSQHRCSNTSFCLRIYLLQQKNKLYKSENVYVAQRLVSGYSSAKLRYVKKRSHCFPTSTKSQQIFEQASAALIVVDALTESEQKRALIEIVCRQNVSRSLTYVNDSAFNYFSAICNKCLPLLVGENVSKHRENIFEFCVSSVESDKPLMNKFKEIVEVISPESAVESKISDTFDEITVSETEAAYTDMNAPKPSASQSSAIEPEGTRGKKAKGKQRRRKQSRTSMALTRKCVGISEEPDVENRFCSYCDEQNPKKRERAENNIILCHVYRPSLYGCAFWAQRDPIKNKVKFKAISQALAEING
ncbi:hypothetical protein MAR_030357, partial [Mya arenaria]